MPRQRTGYPLATWTATASGISSGDTFSARAIMRFCLRLAAIRAGNWQSAYIAMTGTRRIKMIQNQGWKARKTKTTDGPKPRTRPPKIDLPNHVIADGDLSDLSNGFGL